MEIDNFGDQILAEALFNDTEKSSSDDGMATLLESLSSENETDPGSDSDSGSSGIKSVYLIDQRKDITGWLFTRCFRYHDILYYQLLFITGQKLVYKDYLYGRKKKT